jgi:hypothetical protein
MNPNEEEGTMREVSYPMPETLANQVLEMIKLAGKSPEVKELFHAIHHVLAGGSVAIDVAKPGDPKMVAQLAANQAAALELANEVNKQAGTYVTAY